ncbi:cyclin-dependent kinase G-2 isoform X1 [Capsicum chacoense]
MTRGTSSIDRNSENTLIGVTFASSSQDQKFLGMMLVEARMISQPNCSTLHGIQLKIQLAPELLLGAEQYSTTIDMWSMGCIMVEKLSKEPLFNGKIEVNQIDKIFRILGTPNEMIWEGFSKLPGVKVNFLRHL